MTSIAALTPRQQEVVDQICEGRRTKEIAACLGLSERTVEMHRERAMRRVGARNAIHLAFLMGKEAANDRG